MNFKLNAWTLLFALALGAFLYQLNQTKSTNKTPDTNSSKCVIKEMPATDFYVDYGQFLGYSEFLDSLFKQGDKMAPYFQEGFTKYANLINPEVWSFHIPKCEMQEMLKLNPDGEYYAYLIMKEPTQDSMVIDMAFSHRYIPGNTEFETMDKTLAAKGASDLKDGFFDFTTPCPPVCDTSKVNIIN